MGLREHRPRGGPPISATTGSCAAVSASASKKIVAFAAALHAEHDGLGPRPTAQHPQRISKSDVNLVSERNYGIEAGAKQL